MKMKLRFHDALILLGLALTVYGIALYSGRLAVLVSGLLLFLLGAALAKDAKKAGG